MVWLLELTARGWSDVGGFPFGCRGVRNGLENFSLVPCFFYVGFMGWMERVTAVVFSC
jgi:hypothetical protein